MTVDSLLYVGTSRFGYELPADQVLTALDQADIDGAVIAPTHRPDHDFARANGTVTDAVAASAGRLVALARVDPWDGLRAVRMLEQGVADHDVRGLFLHPLEEHFRINDPRVQPLARVANSLGIPVVVATGYQGFSEPVQITRFAQWCPDVPVVLTNGGQFNISGLAQQDAGLALDHDNVFVHTSGVYRDDWISLVVSSFGADRILFASAAPLMNVRYELRRVQLAHVPDEAKQLMLGDNARRIFRIEQAQR